jgi:hypothetical protein
MSGRRLVDLIERCRDLVRCWDALQDHPNHHNARAFTEEAKALQHCLVRLGWVPPTTDTRGGRPDDNVIPLIRR